MLLRTMSQFLEVGRLTLFCPRAHALSHLCEPPLVLPAAAASSARVAGVALTTLPRHGRRPARPVIPPAAAAAGDVGLRGRPAPHVALHGVLVAVRAL